jgi:hypothetical protein
LAEKGEITERGEGARIRSGFEKGATMHHDILQGWG